LIGHAHFTDQVARVLEKGLARVWLIAAMSRC
jgi:hypothetical protein